MSVTHNSRSTEALPSNAYISGTGGTIIQVEDSSAAAAAPSSASTTSIASNYQPPSAFASEFYDHDIAVNPQHQYIQASAYAPQHDPNSNNHHQYAAPSNLYNSAEQSGLNLSGAYLSSEFLNHRMNEILQIQESCQRVLESPSIKQLQLLDFNSAYQDLYDKVPVTLPDIEERNQSLREIQQQFEFYARTVAEVIIVQQQFPPEIARCIQPTEQVGGAAGGEKFIHGNVLFKFARDWLGIYGSDLAASKAAFSEIRSLQHIINAEIGGIHVPLMGVFRLHGQTVIASALAPINSTTLIYGSNDGSHSFVNRHPDAIVSVLDEIQNKIGLAKHLVQTQSHGSVEIVGPVDQELHFSAPNSHQSADRRLYILDLARLLPSMPPLNQSGQSNNATRYLIEFFRPEVIELFRKSRSDVQFSSDVFSHFVDPAGDGAKHEATAGELLDFTVNVQVPAVCQQIIESCSNIIKINRGSSSSFSWSDLAMHFLPVIMNCQPNLSSILHTYGVNMRMLTTVWNQLLGLFHINNDTAHKLALLWVALEMLERTHTQAALKTFSNSSIQPLVNLSHSFPALHTLTLNESDRNHNNNCKCCMQLLDSVCSQSFQQTLDDCLRKYFAGMESSSFASHSAVISTFEFITNSSSLWSNELLKRLQRSSVIAAKFTNLTNMLKRAAREVELVDSLMPEYPIASLNSICVMLSILRQLRDGPVPRSELHQQGLKMCAIVLDKVISIVSLQKPLNEQEFKDIDNAVLNAKTGIVLWKNSGESDYVSSLTVYDSVFQQLTDLLPIPLRQSENLHWKNELDSLNFISNAYERSGEYTKALELHKQALAIIQSHFPENIQMMVTKLHSIGKVSNALGQFNTAMQLLERAVSLQTSSGLDELTLSMICTDLGIVYRQLGRHDKALEQFDRSVAIKQKLLPDSHPFLASAMGSLAIQYSIMKEYAKSLEINLRALAIREKAFPAIHPSIAASLQNVGGSLIDTGEYFEALKCLERALSIQEQTLPAAHPDFPPVLNALGDLFKAVSDFRKAISYYKRAHSILQSVLPAGHPKIAESKESIDDCITSIVIQSLQKENQPQSSVERFWTLGKASELMGDFRLALEFYQKVLIYRYRSLPSKHRLTVQVLRKISDSYRKLDDHVLADKYLIKAITMQKELKEQQLHQARLIGNLDSAFAAAGSMMVEGSRHRKNGDTMKALELYEHAFVVFQVVRRDDAISAALLMIGCAFETLDEMSAALEAFTQALLIMPRNHPQFSQIRGQVEAIKQRIDVISFKVEASPSTVDDAKVIEILSRLKV